MNSLVARLVAVVGVASLMLVGGTQAAPPPTPTKAPSAPTKAAEPTKLAATAAPAKKVDYPAKGKPVTVIVPYAAGGATDVAARLLFSIVEKDLGTPMQIVNKPGAGSQIGVTYLVTSKPDGYTIGHVAFPAVITTYLDPERKAVFSRKDFEPIGKYFSNPVVASVRADSPYKTLKDLIDGAKANPGKIKAGTTGLLGPSHLAILELQRLTGAQFAIVHFDGGNPQMTALLGGHIDLGGNTTPEVLSPFKAGQIRPLGVMAKNESKFLPGTKTFEAQGYTLQASSPVGLVAPAGTPKEIIEILTEAVKRATQSDQFKKKMDELASEIVYMTPQEYAADWAEAEARIRPLLELAKQEAMQK